jgi:DNA-binding NarL/FixJ family response regulator
MRIVLIGSPAARAHLRAWLAGTPSEVVEVVAEADSLAAARAGVPPADAWLMAPPEPESRRADPIDAPAFDEPLTPRELQVLELMAEGLPNKAIARRLEISDQTVKFHVASIGGKLGAANRTDSVRRAVRRGLVTI